MRRFLDYYRQFEELSPEEVSRELRERHEEERRRRLERRPPLDLSGAAWHRPPHAEIVNAATFALRRAVNEYPDQTPLRNAIAAAHGVEPARVVIGHGAGELLRAALRAIVGAAAQTGGAPAADAAGGAGPVGGASRAGGASAGSAAGGALGGAALGGGVTVAVAWPGWGPLPGLVAEAGATPVPVALDALLAGAAAPSGGRLAAVVVARPADPTGAVVPFAELPVLTGDHWLILDEALAGFLPDGEDGLLEHPRVIHVRSFSKAHAMAGFRIGYAVLPPGVELPLAPVLGVGAPALAGAQWAVEHGADSVRRRRAHAAAVRARLEAALADTPFEPAPGHGPYVWLAAPSGRELAEALAARRIYVAPGTAWGDERHVRITLRDAEATDRLIAALRELS